MPGGEEARKTFSLTGAFYCSLASCTWSVVVIVKKGWADFHLQIQENCVTSSLIKEKFPISVIPMAWT